MDEQLVTKRSRSKVYHARKWIRKWTSYNVLNIRFGVARARITKVNSRKIKVITSQELVQRPLRPLFGDEFITSEICGKCECIGKFRVVMRIINIEYWILVSWIGQKNNFFMNIKLEKVKKIEIKIFFISIIKKS